MSSFRTSILLGIAIAIIFVIPGKPTFVHAQSDSIVEKEVCGQPKNVRDPIIDEAESEQFNVRRVEIAGSTYTRDRDFRKRMVYTNEGDIFA